MPLKTENQIWADIISAFNAALADRGIAGFTVRQGNQPVKVTDTKPLVLVHKISETAVGSQFRHDFVDEDTGLLQHEEGYFIELTYQVNAIKQRRDNDTTGTVTASDCVQALRAWLMSEKGYLALRGNGYGILAVKQIAQPYSTDESDAYELSPHFDFTVCIKQSYREPVPEITDKTFTIIRI